MARLTLCSACLSSSLCLFGWTTVVSAHDDDGDRECLPPPAGMTGWWPGDGNAYDIVGGRDAELHSAASFGLAFVDRAFLLHGDGDGDGVGDFVSVADNPALNFGTGNFTVDFWAFFGDPEAGEQVLIEKWIQSFSGPADGWTFTHFPGNELGFFIESAGAGQGVVSGPVPVPAGTWTHFAATRRAGVYALFVNGQRVANSFFAEGNMEAGSSASIKFGHRGNSADTPGSEDESGFYLDGGIDEVEIFVGRALSRDQIRAIYYAGRRGKCKQ